MSLFLDLKAAAEQCSVGIDTLKAAIEKGTLRAKRTTPADPGTKKRAAGKYLIRTTDLEAWFDSLEDA